MITIEHRITMQWLVEMQCNTIQNTSLQLLLLNVCHVNVVSKLL